MKPGGQVPASGQDLARDLLRAQSEHLLTDAFGHDIDRFQAEHLDEPGDLYKVLRFHDNKFPRGLAGIPKG